MLVDAAGQILISDSVAAVTLQSALRRGTRKHLARMPSSVPVATGLEWQGDADGVRRALRRLRKGLLVHKGPCAERCTVVVLPYGPAPGDEVALCLELRYVSG